MTRTERATVIANSPRAQKALDEGKAHHRSRSARRYFRRWTNKAVRVADRAAAARQDEDT